MQAVEETSYSLQKLEIKSTAVKLILLRLAIVTIIAKFMKLATIKSD